MSEQIRKGLGGLCVAATLALIGAAAMVYGLETPALVTLFLGLLTAVGSLLVMANDLLRA